MVVKTLSGLVEEDAHVQHVRVYFEDTDFSGVVYHANYLKFFERGRSDWLRLLGIHHGDLAKGLYGSPLAFAVRHMEIDFLKPAQIDDVLRIETRLKELTGVRFILSQTASRDRVVLATATVTVVMISPDGRPKRIPSAISQLLLGATQQNERPQ